MNKYPVLLFACFLFFRSYAQTDTAAALKCADTAHVNELHEVMVHAYGQNGKLLETPASVRLIDQADLDQYSNTNILPAVNNTPGVRMEERSPGSYRFSIRGSSLESPFGVRNVKIYYNDIPYTDPGGNTYLNQLGFYNIQSLEIIRGPGSSLYGAGTGGVLLINSMPANWQPGVTVNYTGGSYSLSSTEGEIRLGDSSFKNVIRYQHLGSDGYRQQSASRKDVISWDAVMKHGENGELSAHVFYGDLYYQTPGALTLQQYNANAQLARPDAGTTPGAISSKAAIYQKTFLAGFTYKQQFSRVWSNATTLYGDYSQQLNPNLRNYSRTSEPNFGGRTEFKYAHTIGERSSLQWITGAEAQQGLTGDRTYQNVNGAPQNLQSDQEIDNRLLSAFTQLSVQIRNWVFTGGASINQLNVKLATLSTLPYAEQDRTFTSEVAPRLSVLSRLNNNLSVYGTVEKGFSPPTVTELAPTGSAVNFGLNAEQAWNYELGVRGFAVGQRLYYDVNVFYFRMHNAIVDRRDSAGGDSYLNAGSTNQGGLEVYVSYKLLKYTTGAVSSCDIYASYTGDDFHYDKFIQSGVDYSGKQMPGTAPNTAAAGVGVHFKAGIYVNVNYFYSDKIAMDDGNTAYGNAYSLLGGKVGYSRSFRRYAYNVFAGVDNALNQKYSLGNDINAVNGKYYNAAAPINYFAGISLSHLNK